MIPIRHLIIEGTDCSGKSTLYRNLHAATKFKYNIHDRSALSMLCYARLYGRDELPYREALRAELCDGNNFVIVLMLPLDVILRRFRSRGDELQDERSLTALHRIFDEEVRKIESLPNVLVIREEHPADRITALASQAVERYEQQTHEAFGEAIKRWTSLADNAEVQLNVSFDVPLDHDDPSILKDPREGEYYWDILNEVHYIIDREIEGKNPYNAPQDVSSRRFYFHSDTCISSIHFIPRGGHLKVLCALRSTDAVRNGSLDLRFLAHISSAAGRAYPDWHIERVTLDVTFNSLHVRTDAV